MDIKKWVKRCDALGSRITRWGTDGRKEVFWANLSGTAQEKDIGVHTPEGLMGNGFYRTKNNLKIKPEEYNAADEDTQVRMLMEATKNEFDMPHWATIKLGTPLIDNNLAFIAQSKSCNVYCPWCFVGDESKNGKLENGAFFGAAEIVNAFGEEAKKQTLTYLRLSGGEPLLTPFTWIDILEELAKRGLEKKVFFQGETNQTTGSYVESLIQQVRLDRHFFEKVGEYKNFGVLCSFKGTDIESMLNAIGLPNPKLSFLEEERWATFDKFVRAGIDAYPFVYDPNPATLPAFIEKGVSLYGPEFASKTWVFPLKLYGAEKQRLDKRGIDHEAFQDRLENNFKQAEEIMGGLIPRIAGHEYKAVPRAYVQLKPKN